MKLALFLYFDTLDFDTIMVRVSNDTLNIYLNFVPQIMNGAYWFSSNLFFFELLLFYGENGIFLITKKYFYI